MYFIKKILLILIFLLLFPLITINSDKDEVKTETIIVENSETLDDEKNEEILELENNNEILNEEEVKNEEIFFEEGIASFYGGKFQGRKTANGEIFDTYKISAAHKKLPFGTMVRVENIKNGKSVIVRINDRGPFIKGRIIDLSTAAFKEIEEPIKGLAKVKLYIIKEIKN